MTCACGTGGHLRRGMCGTCYMRWLRKQSVSLRKSADQRFWPNVNKDGPAPAHRPELGPCWPWTGKGRTRKGYGYFVPQGRRKVYVHRWSWEQANGPIPAGLTIDHLCKNVSCVNPGPLEAVTMGENVRRGQVPQRCPHCPQVMVPANLPRHIAARHLRAPQGESLAAGVCEECWRVISGRALRDSGMVLLRRHKPRAGAKHWCSRGERCEVPAYVPIYLGSGETE